MEPSSTVPSCVPRTRCRLHQGSEPKAPPAPNSPLSPGPRTLSKAEEPSSLRGESRGGADSQDGVSFAFHSGPPTVRSFVIGCVVPRLSNQEAIFGGAGASVHTRASSYSLWAFRSPRPVPPCAPAVTQQAGATRLGRKGQSTLLPALGPHSWAVGAAGRIVG